MLQKLTLYLLTIWGIGLFLVPQDAFSFVTRQEGKTFIVDQTGNRWDITQAVSIGFKPEGFQYGIGKKAFTPLDDSRLSGETSGILPDHRVLGIEAGGKAKAYSIPKLSRHEIANSEIGSQPIAAAY